MQSTIAYTPDRGDTSEVHNTSFTSNDDGMITKAEIWDGRHRVIDYTNDMSGQAVQSG